jgi:hypothetical protein
LIGLESIVEMMEIVLLRLLTESQLLDVQELIKELVPGLSVSMGR